VVTPNLDEAAALLDAAGREVGEGAEALARAVHALGPGAVVVTGGHDGGDEVVDVFFDGELLERIAGPRYPGGASHGSGCTHSSTLAAALALGLEPIDAAREAKRIASEAVRDGLRELGAGSGPVNVFGGSWRGSASGR
jgi:hydroxymethylpyrimidine/phosphomethylpyrimidine kinase